MSPQDLIAYVIAHLDEQQLFTEVSLLGLDEENQEAVLKAAHDPEVWNVGPADKIKWETSCGDVKIPKGATCYRAYLEDDIADALNVDLYLVDDKVIAIHLSAD